MFLTDALGYLVKGMVFGWSPVDFANSIGGGCIAFDACTKRISPRYVSEAVNNLSISDGVSLALVIFCIQPF